MIFLLFFLPSMKRQLLLGKIVNRFCTVPNHTVHNDKKAKRKVVYGGAA